MAQQQGMGGCAQVFLGLIGVVVLLYLVGSCSEPANVTPKPAAAPMDSSIQAAAVAKFTAMPAIEHVEWLDGNFIIAARDNGQSWSPVANAACAWIRGQGARGEFSVDVLEAGALRNKRWEQLAHARCN